MLQKLKQLLKVGAYIVAGLGALSYFISEIEKIDNGKIIEDFKKESEPEQPKEEI